MVLTPRIPLRRQLTRWVTILSVVFLFYSVVAFPFDWPPYNWIEDYRHRHDKIVRHRPHFKKVERYSNEHRYRPAASPVIKRVGKDGKVKLKGDYHVAHL